MGSLGDETTRNKAMWLYPKVLGFNPPERWGHSACYSHGVVYVFGVCLIFFNDRNSDFFPFFCLTMIISAYPIKLFVTDISFTSAAWMTYIFVLYKVMPTSD